MDRKNVLAILAEALIELQTRSGLSQPTVSGDTKPLELEEFDSLKCVELEVLVSERVGFEVRDVVIQKADPKAVLTISQIVDLIIKAGEEAADHA